MKKVIYCSLIIAMFINFVLPVKAGNDFFTKAMNDLKEELLSNTNTELPDINEVTYYSDGAFYYTDVPDDPDSSIITSKEEIQAKINELKIELNFDIQADKATLTMEKNEITIAFNFKDQGGKLHVIITNISSLSQEQLFHHQFIYSSIINNITEKIFDYKGYNETQKQAYFDYASSATDNPTIKYVEFVGPVEYTYSNENSGFSINSSGTLYEQTIYDYTNFKIDDAILNSKTVETTTNTYNKSTNITETNTDNTSTKKTTANTTNPHTFVNSRSLVNIGVIALLIIILISVIKKNYFFNL